VIFISFTLDNFRDCINFFESNDFYFKTITDLSATEDGNYCIKNNEVRMISLDNIKNYFTSKRIPKSRVHCSICKKTGKCRANFDHNSVDALYVNFSRVLIIFIYSNLKKLIFTINMRFLVMN